MGFPPSPVYWLTEERQYVYFQIFHLSSTFRLKLWTNLSCTYPGQFGRSNRTRMIYYRTVNVVLCLASKTNLLFILRFQTRSNPKEWFKKKLLDYQSRFAQLLLIFWFKRYGNNFGAATMITCCSTVSEWPSIKWHHFPVKLNFWKRGKEITCLLEKQSFAKHRILSLINKRFSFDNRGSSFLSGYSLITVISILVNGGAVASVGV